MSIKFLCLMSCLSVMILVCACKTDTTHSSKPAVPEESEVQIDLINNKKSMLVDSSNSLINWSGSKPGKTHTGILKIKSGTIGYVDSRLVSAQVKFDMESITVTDLKDKSKQKLEAHLKGTNSGNEDDFFNVTQYPEASFKTTKLVEIKNDQDYNYLAYGLLTIKEVVQEVAFKINAEFKSNRVIIKSADFSIDRTNWGIRFKSKSFYNNLKDNFISDEIKLKFTLEATADR